jgi:transcriptional regulator with XRE-family HTH domain
MQEQPPSSLAVQIGQRVRKVRQMRSLTQKALAERLAGGVDYSYIGKIERGEQLPSLKVLQRIAEALNVPLGYFFSDEAWTNLLPEEIRGVRRHGVQLQLLRETMGLHADDVALVREIQRILARHRHQLRTREGREPTQQPLPRVAESRPAYERGNQLAVPREVLQGIRKVIRSLQEGESERLDDIRYQLEGILKVLAPLGRARGKVGSRASR